MNVFGLKQVVITDSAGANPVTLPAGMVLRVQESYEDADFTAEGLRVAQRALLTGLEWDIEAGGISLDAWAKLTGRSKTTQSLPQGSGGTTYTLAATSAIAVPYVRVYGRSIADDAAGDLHVKIYRAKVTGLEGTFREGEFWVSACRGVAVYDSSGALWDFVQHTYAVGI